jgi:hypothetical protein
MARKANFLAPLKWRPAKLAGAAGMDKAQISRALVDGVAQAAFWRRSQPLG